MLPSQLTPTLAPTNQAAILITPTPSANDLIHVSVASDGTPGNRGSSAPSISADGRYVAFLSSASNLVSEDTNEAGDIFVHDIQTGTTTRVSVASDGTQANNGSRQCTSISADGSYVAFMSYASNLVSGDTNEAGDIFLHNMQTGETIRISVATDGTQGNGHSDAPDISADGRYIAFTSQASNLVPGDTNNGDDIFVHDIHSGETSRISVSSDGTQGNEVSRYSSISADGNYVVFFSGASNLVSEDTNGTGDVFIHEMQTGVTKRVSEASDGMQGNNQSIIPQFPSDGRTISSDGRYVVFFSHASNLVAGDSNESVDVFIHDMQTDETTSPSLKLLDTIKNYFVDEQFKLSISPDGHYVLFVAYSKSQYNLDNYDLIDLITYDVRSGIIKPIAVIDLSRENVTGFFLTFPSISADGRYMVGLCEGINVCVAKWDIP
jgi:Tol biopolymer transport system component